MSSDDDDLPVADHVFDGGAMDCGSGLILLIRQNMLEVPVGGLLEIRSSEPTVESELPPWCRMVGHTHVRSVSTGDGRWRHWVRRGEQTQTETEGLDSDKRQAQEFKWSLRARRSSSGSTGSGETTVYARNFSWKSSHSVDFDRSGELPGSLEQFFGSLLGDVVNCFAIRCSREGLEIDELEATLNGTLVNSLAAVGLEQGDSSVRLIQLVVYVTSPATQETIQQAWSRALGDSPVYQTVSKACEVNVRMVLM